MAKVKVAKEKAIKAKAPKTAKAKAKADAPKADVKPKEPTAKKGSSAKDEGRTLVIVESPTKAKTIGKYLGPSYTVKATVGHLRDLPQRELGVDVDAGFAPKYVTIRGKGKTLAELKRAAKDSARIFLATDPDREGEAIAWHIAEKLGYPKKKNVRRVLFNEITKKAVQEAIKQPRDLDRHLYDAQQARRVLDRIVGYPLSRLLSKSISRGLSAGRVQSVTVRLIVDREKEIRAFKAVDYWRVFADVKKTGAQDEDAFTTDLVHVDQAVVDDAAWANDAVVPEGTEEELAESTGEVETGKRLLRRPTNAATLRVTSRLGARGAATLGARFAGDRDDLDFKTFSRVTLHPYTRVQATLEYAVLPGGGAVPAITLQIQGENLLADTGREIANFPVRGRTLFFGMTLGAGSQGSR